MLCSVEFYRDVVGLPVALELSERCATFHWIGQPGQAMLGLWAIGAAPIEHAHVGLARG
jgi:hypothetical protein